MTPRRLLLPLLAAFALAACDSQEEGDPPDPDPPAVLFEPKPVAGGRAFVAISAGRAHTCALTGGGEAYCWGYNFHGELGSGTLGGPNPTPAQVTGGLTFSSISAGGRHTCALTPSGRAYCWGGGGTLGNSGRLYESPHSPTPQRVLGELTFVSINAGHEHTCALDGEGKAYCWGQNVWSQLGIGEMGSSRASSGRPTPVVGGLAFRSISPGDYHTCGATTSGELYCWGDNARGAFIPPWAPDAWFFDRPVRVPSGHSFVSVHAGSEHTCGLTDAGEVHCWGFNHLGQLGNRGSGGVTPLSPSSRVAAQGVAFASLSSGSIHSCAVDPAGEAYCWGANGGLDGNRPGTPSWLRAVDGRLGRYPANICYPEGVGSSGSCGKHPENVPGGLTFRAVSAGGVHTCALTPANEAYCWGSNEYGQLGRGE